MPVYEYEHTEEACEIGPIFEVTHPISDDALRACPGCGRPIKRLISRVYVSSPTSDTELKSQGFAKLVRRDSGVYENVTALNGESRYFEAGKPDSAPDFKRRGLD